MKISTKKSIAWFMTLGGAGGVVLFLALCVDRGPPGGPELGIYAWPVISLVVALFSGWALRRLYRAEPFDWRGFWQIGTVELLFVAFYVGLMLSVSKLLGSSVLPLGIALSLLMGLLSVWGMLLGARKGLVEPRQRIMFGIGWVYWWLGAFGLGGFVGVLILLVFIEPHEVVEYFFDVLYFTKARINGPDWLRFIFRPAIILFPLGIVLTRLATRGLPQEVAAPDEPAFEIDQPAPESPPPEAR